MVDENGYEKDVVVEHVGLIGAREFVIMCAERGEAVPPEFLQEWKERGFDLQQEAAAAKVSLVHRLEARIRLGELQQKLMHLHPARRSQMGVRVDDIGMHLARRVVNARQDDDAVFFPRVQ